MQIIKIKSIQKIQPEVKCELEVEDNHNFFVNGILKHNCRCVVILDGEVKCFSRTGNQFGTLDKIEKILYPYRNAGLVLDGEICSLDENDLDDFKGVMKEITRKNHTMENPSYILFDCLTLDEFNQKSDSLIFNKRLLRIKMLTDRINNKALRNLEQIPYSTEKFEEMLKEVDEKDWEGLILRKDAKYKGKRSKDILKAKTFFDDEFKVVSLNMSTKQCIIKTEELIPNGGFILVQPETGDSRDAFKKYTTTVSNKVELPTLGAAVINYKGNEVGVGSGWTEQERLYYYKHPEELIGKIITVKYKKESVDENGKKSLQFPVVKFIHGIKRIT